MTSLAQYAIKGYEVNAFDFIVKPFEYYDFALKLERALPYLKQNKNKTIVISNKQIMRKLYISQIVDKIGHFGVLSNYICIFERI